MAKVWNPTEENVTTKIFGSYFEFKAGAMKTIVNEHVATFIDQNRKETGLVVLPPQFDPLNEEHFVEGYEKTPEGKEALAQKKREGIQNLIAFHEQIVYNNQVALRNDLVHKDPHTDPVKLAAINASKGELESMRLVAKYRKIRVDGSEAQTKEVDKLMAEIGPIGR